MRHARAIWNSFGAPIVVVVCLIVIAVGIASKLISDDCDFCPLRIEQLEVRPSVVTIGEYATLLDGVCNDTKQTLNAQIYMGAQRENGSSLMTPTLDLLTREDPPGSGIRVPVRDTQEERLRRLFEPGCTPTEPIVARVPPTFTPGFWHLYIHIVVTGPEGQVQNLTKTSGTFEVVAGSVAR